MRVKQTQETLRLLFPQHSRVRKVIVLEDLHKLNNPVKAVLLQLLREFSELENNQIIVCTMRGAMEIGTFPDYSVCLEGLTNADKLTTLRTYMPCLPETILFHRATDDLLIFSNILQGILGRIRDIYPRFVDFESPEPEMFSTCKSRELTTLSSTPS